MADVRTIELHEIISTDGNVFVIGGYNPDPEKQKGIDVFVAELLGDASAEHKVARYQRRVTTVEMPDSLRYCGECGATDGGGCGACPEPADDHA